MVKARQQKRHHHGDHLCHGVTVCAALALSAVTAHAQIVINEMDYDQSGADSRDFVELCEPGKTGMSLSEWELYLYDGTSSKCSPYLIVDLSTAPGGVMPADGYLVIGTNGAVPNVDIPAPKKGWIHNGSPDGMALVHNGEVIELELLAYEGTFVGSNGPAAGMPFPDIGVEEYGGDGNGLQRIPDGGDWTETPESAATPGEPNPPSWDVFAYGQLTLMQRSDADSGPIELCADGEMPPYTFTIITLPTHGALVHDPGTIATVPTDVQGVLTYSADVGFSGLDAFEFTVRDSGGSQSPAAAVQEIGVQWQIDGVVISEVMPWPSRDQRVYEYIEVYNNTAGTVDLGCLDTYPPLSSETAGNLLGHSIPPGVGRIIAPDPRALGHSLHLFRCEWGLFESEIIRVPFANWEALFSFPDAECSATDGSRLLLFDAAGNLLDAVDLTLAELAPPAYGESLTIHYQLLEPPGGPLNTQNNDAPAPWVYAQTSGTPGVRTSLRGDFGGPMFVPTFSTGPYTPDDPCVGRCCLPENECATLTYDVCAADGNPETWVPGTWCELDLTNFQAFADCLAGPDATPPGGCSSQDADGDGDVDLDDFAAFQIAFTSVPCP